MAMMSPLNNNQQAFFSLEEAKVRALNAGLRTRENKEELLKTARKFEGVFIQQLLNEMDKTIERSDFLSGGSGEEMFRGLFYEKVAENIATRPGGSGFGIAEAIYRQLEKQLPKPTAEGTDADDSSRAVTP